MLVLHGHMFINLDLLLPLDTCVGSASPCHCWFGLPFLGLLPDLYLPLVLALGWLQGATRD